ncbi:hypothetical protein Javan629_0033 [Streptococcus phage Javan629]|uniref:DUF1642 domain-containing protein n=1 Tax=Streptococcus uberis TaxID=1349 RepID=UPI0006215EC6|nr:DUF1642 domain-containing protein [Streptococcus uberis]KKF47149.1 hypothetical protein AF62_08240 [Streptococcus uberis C8329]QBX22035.1 hypothetical protein Javan629_0033 [Streptococcus phage Javan629]
MKIEGLKKDTPIWVRGYVDGFGNIDFLGSDRDCGLDYLSREDILQMLDDDLRLDESTQPQLEVPQFVADWYEEHKDNFYLNLHRLAWELIENLDEDDFVPKKALDSDFKRWYHKTETAIQTLINMHQFGYTVEKEKLYTVVIPNPHEKQLSFVLMRRPNGNVIINVVHSSNLDLLKTDNDLQLTEAEIRKDFDWAWQWKKEVTE